MVSRSHRTALSFSGAIASLALATGSASASTLSPASVPLARQPVITIAINVPDVMRVDRLLGSNVVFAGVDAKSQVRVNWGDGGPTEKQRGSCGTKGAISYPDACTVSMVPGYGAPGVYTITAVAGKQIVSKTITVVAAPTAWTPPSGWVQPAGWKMGWYGATYTPCQKVDWYFDRTGEPSDRVRMRDDLVAGLGTLGAESGLNFQETSDPALADLTFKWGDLTYRGADVAGIGGPEGAGKGSVTFSYSNEWTKDVWAGRGYMRKENYPSPGWYWENDGRQTLILHEVMHAMGFGHVDDQSSIMHPSTPNGTTLNAGDLDGLATMYKNNSCPAIPD